MATRSGARFKPAEQIQTSLWCLHIQDLAEVLSAYLPLQYKLKSRAVCKAWRSAWGSQVPGLMLKQPKQPMSVAAARSLGRKAAAAFPDVTKARITLYRSGIEACFDLSSDGDLQEQSVPADSERPAAAKACLRQLRTLRSLRQVHFSTSRPAAAPCKALSFVLPQLPGQQICVLDLTETQQATSVLPVIAEHLSQLQELVLGWVRPWSDSDMAALASVPTLRKLSCVFLPTPQHTSGIGSVTQLTELTLKLLEPEASSDESEQLSSAVVRQLSSLTDLRSLNVHLASAKTWMRLEVLRHPYNYMGAWPVALAGMSQLGRLLIRNIVLTDEFLCAAGKLPLQFLGLIMGDAHNMSHVTAVGAAAVEQVGAIEITFNKRFDACCREFTSLPCVKRFVCEWLSGRCWADSSTCTCAVCWPEDTHCRRPGYARTCCGHCKGKQCACDTAAQLAAAMGDSD